MVVFLWEIQGTTTNFIKWNNNLWMRSESFGISHLFLYARLLGDHQRLYRRNEIAAYVAFLQSQDGKKGTPLFSCPHATQ